MKQTLFTIGLVQDKLAVVLSSKSTSGEIEIIDSATQDIKGIIRNGVIVNPNNMLANINNLLENMASKHNIKISNYYLAIEPHTLRSEIIEVSCNAERQLADSEKAIEKVASEFKLDNNRKIIKIKKHEIKTGTTVTGKFIAISTASFIKNQIDKTIANCSTYYKPIYCISPLIEAEYVLTEKQKNDGTLFLNFSDHTISLSLFQNGLPMLVATLPLGYQNIVNDISKKFGVDISIAQLMTKKYGVAATNFVESDRKFRVAEQIDFTLKELAGVIEARLCETIDFILQEIAKQNLKDAYKEIVLFGNINNINSAKELLEQQSNKKALEYVLSSKDTIANIEPKLNLTITSLINSKTEDCTISEVHKPVEPTPKTKNTQSKDTRSDTGRSLWGRFTNLTDTLTNLGNTAFE